MRKTAEGYVAEGYLWNSGNFMFRAGLLLDEFRDFEPASAAAVAASVAAAGDDLGFMTLDAEAFARATAKSIDYAVMERTTRAAVIPVTYSWSDVGSWNAVWELSQHDANGNAAHGKAVFVDARDSYVTTDKQLVALYGVENLIVATTDDAVLVARRDDGDGLRRLVKQLKEVAPAVTEEHLRFIVRGAPINRSIRAIASRSSASSSSPAAACLCSCIIIAPNIGSSYAVRRE